MGFITRNRWVRIQFVTMVFYILSQVDKANIAVAFPSIRHELGISPTALGFAVGLFAWGYLVLQIPVGRLTSAWSAKYTLLFMGVAWSLTTISTALVQTETQLSVNRFVLGVFEGGILPGFVVMIHAWFTPRERGRANLVLLGTIIAAALGNAVCGWIVELVGWRMMMVVTGGFTLLWCVVWWLTVDDDPRKCNWLDPEVKRALVAELDACQKEEPQSTKHWFKEIWHPTVLLLGVYNILGLTAFWGMTFWLPSLLVEGGRTIGNAGLLAAIPYVVAIVIATLISCSSDHFLERRWHLIVPTILAGVSMGCIGVFGTQNVYLLIICLSLTVGFWFGRIAVFWICVADAVPRGSAGAAMAVANGFGNLGGFFGPVVFGYLRTTSGGYASSMMVGGVALVAAGLMATVMRRKGHSICTDDGEKQVAGRPISVRS
jgi:predicted MFS family arabinose efflux permease